MDRPNAAADDSLEVLEVTKLFLRATLQYIEVKAMTVKMKANVTADQLT